MSDMFGFYITLVQQFNFHDPMKFVISRFDCTDFYFYYPEVPLHESATNVCIQKNDCVVFFVSWELDVSSLERNTIFVIVITVMWHFCWNPQKGETLNIEGPCFVCMWTDRLVLLIKFFILSCTIFINRKNEYYDILCKKTIYNVINLLLL